MRPPLSLPLLRTRAVRWIAGAAALAGIGVLGVEAVQFSGGGQARPATAAARPAQVGPARSVQPTGESLAGAPGELLAQRQVAAEYPLSYQPKAAPAAGAPPHPGPGASSPADAATGAGASAAAAAGLSNPKSKPLQLDPSVPPGSRGPAAFPQAAASLQPQLPSPAAPALPGGALPAVTAATGAPVPRAAVTALIQRHFPAAEWDRAQRVSLCESGQRNVVSAPNGDGTRDYGIFQLNTGTLAGLLRSQGLAPTAVDMALDADWNVAAAARLWSQRGWQPWVCAAKLGIVDGLYSSRPGPNAGGPASR